MCIPTKPNKDVKSPKSGETCGNSYALTELGAKGEKGEKGEKGVSGVNSPLVFGPYAASASDPDGSECGGNWAEDEYSRTFIVSPQAPGSNGGFTVTELFKGTFTTDSGAQTPGLPCKALGSGIKGTFYGDYVWNVSPNLFNPEPTSITDPGACTGSEHFDEVHFGVAIAGGCAGLEDFRWQFHYTDGAGGAGHEWTNAEEAVVHHPIEAGHPESEGNIES